MNVIWYKVWFDLWENKLRTSLAVLSIAVGVFAIGAIFGMVDQLLSGMDRAHQAVTPSHIFMAFNDYIDQRTVDGLKKTNGVEGIEALNEAAVRYKIKPDDEWQAARLIMRADYDEQTYDTLELKEGVWPTKKNMAIERLSSQHFDIDIGDTIIFELDKTDRALPITSKIRHNFVEPPAFGGDAVFFTDAQGMARFDVPDGVFGSIFVRISPYSPELARDIASDLKDRLAKEGVGVAFTSYQDPDEHWGRPFVQGLNLVLQILAVVSLFMSVVLVMNTMTALITNQVNQIGIIKAIGGSTGTILNIYLATVLIYGTLAFIISLPLGAVVAFGLTQWFLNIFNIDYEVFRFSTRGIILQAVAATLIPLLAALWPVITGSLITVREAIASYGLGQGNAGTGLVDKVVNFFGQRLPASYATALGNMLRRKGRLVLTQLVLITAGTMFLIVMSLSASIDYTLETELARRGFDIRIGFQGDYRIDRAYDLAERVPGVAETEMWFTSPAALLKAGQRLKEAGVGAEIIGIPAGSQMYKPLMVRGRWLQPGDGRVLVISRSLAEDNGINVGDTVTLNAFELGASEWQVIGVFQVIFAGGFDAQPIYAPQQAIFDVTKQHNRGSRLFVSTTSQSPDAIAQIQQSLKDVYENRQMPIDVFVTGSTPEDRANAISQFSITTTMLLALAVIVALVGGIGLMGSLSISVVERTREIGVMRAIGARSTTIMGIFVMEGVLQGLISWVVALPLSLIIAGRLADALGQAMFDANLDYQYNFTAGAIWLVVVLVISVLASILPARSATRISVRDSLAYA
ncbi:MAG: FtsX-like permease family protein [Chloroflexota bacterium]